jgi:hypothetical protein
MAFNMDYTIGKNKMFLCGTLVLKGLETPTGTSMVIEEPKEK